MSSAGRDPERRTEMADKPNTIVFMTDDMGWGDLGCVGRGLTAG